MCSFLCHSLKNTISFSYIGSCFVVYSQFIVNKIRKLLSTISVRYSKKSSIVWFNHPHNSYLKIDDVCIYPYITYILWGSAHEVNICHVVRSRQTRKGHQIETKSKIKISYEQQDKNRRNLKFPTFFELAYFRHLKKLYNFIVFISISQNLALLLKKIYTNCKLMAKIYKMTYETSLLYQNGVMACFHCIHLHRTRIRTPVQLLLFCIDILLNMLTSH